MTKIKEIPENDRPIERLINIGAQNLSNEELISILLRTGNKDESSKELASKIISSIEGIKNLKQITLEQLLKYKGIGVSKATILLSAIELGKRMNNEIEEIRNVKGNQPELIFKYYKNKLENLTQEHFYALYLDTSKKIIKEKLLFIGTINYSLVHPRDVFKEAYLSSASSIIFVHNHPTGNVIPSKNDIDTTHNLIEVGKLLGISVVDHIIIGKHKYYSFYENGDI
jgi:DNA repair protein RadC